MVDADIYPQLSEMFQDIFMRDDIVLAPSTTAKDVDGWDSMKMIEIIMAVEEKYGIKLQTKEIDNLNSVGDLVTLIAAKAA